MKIRKNQIAALGVVLAVGAILLIARPLPKVSAVNSPTVSETSDLSPTIPLAKQESSPVPDETTPQPLSAPRSTPVVSDTSTTPSAAPAASPEASAPADEPTPEPSSTPATLYDADGNTVGTATTIPLR
jgi:hypothetical protein